MELFGLTCAGVRASVFVLQFFEKAEENVKENVGDDIQTDHLIKEACRNVLEHVRHSEAHETT